MIRRKFDCFIRTSNIIRFLGWFTWLHSSRLLFNNVSFMDKIWRWMNIKWMFSCIILIIIIVVVVVTVVIVGAYHKTYSYTHEGRRIYKDKWFSVWYFPFSLYIHGCFLWQWLVLPLYLHSLPSSLWVLLRCNSLWNETEENFCSSLFMKMSFYYKNTILLYFLIIWLVLATTTTTRCY